jgi:hypothetical protein
VSPFPWFSEPEWEADTWGAAAIELQLVERRTNATDVREPV